LTLSSLRPYSSFAPTWSFLFLLTCFFLPSNLILHSYQHDPSFILTCFFLPVPDRRMWAQLAPSIQQRE
jgi:hypothetical protein